MKHLFPSHLAFRKSSYSDRNNCVEIATLPEGAAVRDSQHPEQGHISVPTAEWSAFLADVQTDQL